MVRQETRGEGISTQKYLGTSIGKEAFHPYPVKLRTKKLMIPLAKPAIMLMTLKKRAGRRRLHLL